MAHPLPTFGLPTHFDCKRENRSVAGLVASVRVPRAQNHRYVETVPVARAKVLAVRLRALVYPVKKSQRPHR
jgi:hypothetical protein